MANELSISGINSGSTAYALLRDTVGGVWRTTSSAFESQSQANLADYALALTEQGTTGVYRGNLPSAPAGRYVAEYRLRAGGAPAWTDPVLGVETIDWSGTAVMGLGSIPAAPAASVIADAVWDEARAGHVTAGTFGEVLEGSDGTVASATSTTVGLGASAPAIDLTGLSVRIVSGLGAPQERRITAYDTGTKVATIAPAWGVTPDVTSTYLIGGRDVWSNDTRTLTDKAGFKLASDGLGLCAADANVTVVELLRRIGATTAGVETRPTATTVAYAAVGAPSTVLVTGTINATTGIRESVTYS